MDGTVLDCCCCCCWSLDAECLWWWYMYVWMNKFILNCMYYIIICIEWSGVCTHKYFYFIWFYFRFYFSFYMYTYNNIHIQYRFEKKPKNVGKKIYENIILHAGRILCCSSVELMLFGTWYKLHTYIRVLGWVPKSTNTFKSIRIAGTGMLRDGMGMALPETQGTRNGEVWRSRGLDGADVFKACSDGSGFRWSLLTIHRFNLPDE